MTRVAVFVACVLIATGPALADIPVAIPDFQVSTGNPWSYGVTLTEDQTIYGLNLQGWWDDGGTYAWPSEMEVYVNPPSGNAFDWDPITDVTGTDPYYFDATVDNVWPTGENSVGYWSFAFGTSYGTADMWDVTMNLLSTPPMPPDPPASTSIGVPSETDGYMDSGEVHWYSFSLAETTEVDMNTLLSAGISDTEIGLYGDWGELIETNDDWGGGGFLSQIIRTLDAGTYYLAVAGYNSSFGFSDFDVSGGTATGDYTLQVIPEPSTLALLALGGLALLRRR